MEPEILATGNPHSHTCLDVERSAFLQHLHWLPDLLLRKVTQAPDDTAEAESKHPGHGEGLGYTLYYDEVQVRFPIHP